MSRAAIVCARWWILFVANLGVVAAAPRLPAVFGEHMVVQADRPTPCWGWAAPRANVQIAFVADHGSARGEVRATADEKGRWRAVLPALPAGARGELRVKDASGETVVRDVLAGEVWLGSGQSNMTYRIGAPDFPPRVLETARGEAAGVADQLRFFTVIQEGADAPQDDLRGKWVVVSPATVENCSAVAWNFALALHRELKTPVGMIVSGHGGTPVESWLSREALDATSSADAVWKRHAELVARFPEEQKTYLAQLADWEAKNPTPESKKQNAGAKPREPYSPTSSRAPTRLFNRMIHGLAPYALQGVIWYQGEENSGRPAEYAPLIQALVRSWRKQWNAELPFYYVELANARAPQSKPSEGGWALIREAQAAALALPKTGVATAVDVSDGTIHPWNKKPVGERLAALALADVYGRPREARGPEYESHVASGGKVLVRLRHAAGLRVRGDGEPAGFAIRGGDGEWRWANARVVDGGVEVWNPEVTQPVAVRYGWASNPVLSLENAAGLPLRPFRTDPDFP